MNRRDFSDFVVTSAVSDKCARECRDIAAAHRALATQASSQLAAEFAVDIAAAWERMAAAIEGEAK